MDRRVLLYRAVSISCKQCNTSQCVTQSLVMLQLLRAAEDTIHLGDPPRCLCKTQLQLAQPLQVARSTALVVHSAISERRKALMWDHLKRQSIRT